jgi:hypothetical protein
VIERVKMRRALSASMEPSLAPQIFAPRVNDLIARGGSAAPVKMPKVEDLQSRTLSSVDKIGLTANRILNNINEWLTV